MLSRYGFTKPDFARVTFYSSGRKKPSCWEARALREVKSTALPEGEGVIYKLPTAFPTMPISLLLLDPSPIV
jgi:hypothetical protein